MNSNGDIQLHSQHCNPLQAVDHDVTQKNPNFFLHSPDQRPASLKKPQNVAFRPRIVPSRLRHTGNDSPHLPPLRDHFAAVDKKHTQNLPGADTRTSICPSRPENPTCLRTPIFSPSPPPPPHSCPFVVQPPPLHSCPFVVQNRHSICGSEHGIRRSRHPSPPSPLPFQGRGVPGGAEV